MYKAGEIIKIYKDGYGENDSIRLEGNPHPIHNETTKYWMKGMFVCKDLAEGKEDGRSCNGCVNRCGERPVFVKIYEGTNSDVLDAMNNQGNICISSAYIGKTYGIVKNQENTCTVMEFIDGKNVFDFCCEMGNIVDPDKRRGLNSRERLVMKYRLMRQMLYAVNDYQKYRNENGIGIHMDLKPEHFLVVKGEKWNDFQVKLIDFESFTNQNQKLKTFQMTVGYAHPEQIECMIQSKIAIQIKPFWDYYALGVVFYEMLEEEYFFSEEEKKQRISSPMEVQKNISLRKHQNDMEEEEMEQMLHLVSKMVAVEEHWDSVEEIIRYLNDFLNQWVGKEEIKLLQSPEFLKKDELELIHSPYVQVVFSVFTERQKVFQQIFEVPQCGIVSLAYASNIPVWNEETWGKMAGFLCEYDGKVNCFLLESETSVRLAVGTTLQFGSCKMHVQSIQKMGYKTKSKRKGFGNSIEYI